MPRTIVLLDTETTGLSNHQPDSTAGFGILQLSALRFTLGDDGTLTYTGHLNLAIEPDVQLMDPATGMPRLPFYEDYAATATARAYREACESELGFFRCALKDGAFTPHADGNGRRSYLRGVLDPWKLEESMPATRRERLQKLVTDTLAAQAIHFESLGEAAKASELRGLAKAMTAELAAEPHLLDHIDGAFFAAAANGVKSRDALREKSRAFGQPESVGYEEACRQFAAFYDGAEIMVAQNAAYDYAVLRRMFHEAKAAGMAIPEFPIQQADVADLQLMTARLPERYGKRTNLDALIEGLPVTETSVAKIRGFTPDALARMLHQPGGAVLHRLDSTQAASVDGVAHDGMEDTILTAAALAEVAPFGVPTMTEAAAALPGVGRGVTAGREALEAAGMSARDAGTGYALWLPLESRSSAGKLLRNYLMVRDRDSVSQGFQPAVLRANGEGLLLNLQRMAYHVSGLIPLLELASHPAVADIYLDPNSKYGGKSFLNVTLNTEPPTVAGATLADWIASSAGLSWHDSRDMTADLTLIGRVREGLKARGGNGGANGPKAPSPSVELNREVLRIRYDTAAEARVLPLLERVTAVLGAPAATAEGTRVTVEIPREALTRAMLNGALGDALPPLPAPRGVMYG